MMVDNQTFIAQVKQLYLNNPGAIANIVYHKLEGFLQESETHQLDEDGSRCLFAVRNNQLIFYWASQLERFMLPTGLLRYLDFLVLHADYYRLIADALTAFAIDEGYPLFYDHTFRQPSLERGRYYLDDFDFGAEADYAAAGEIITATASGYALTAERVRGWTRKKAFDPMLWLLVRERQSGQPVGVGITNYFAPMREADLDWFFVHPDHQSKGIGRMLIAQTIRRCQPKSDIIRLGGIADGFYQKCGFQRGEKWIVAQKRNDGLSHRSVL